MTKPRSFITQTFMDKIRTEGKLAKALTRLSTDLGQYEPLPRFSIWSLICEEILDTDENPLFYERVVAELKRRGINDDEIEQMRMFAWRTAGWLNYEKMVWEWVRLDESDIRRALDWQVKEGEISNLERLASLKYLSKYCQNGS